MGGFEQGGLDMDEQLSRAFAIFLRDKLQPAVQEVNGRKRSVLHTSLVVGAGLFALLAVGVYYIMAPYRKLMQDHSLSYWPMFLLVPLAVAMIGFSLTYIIGLKSLVSDFRGVLVRRLAEYVDPGLVYEEHRPLSDDVIRDGLIFANFQAQSGSDCFRGRIGSGTAELVPIQVQVKQAGKEGGTLRHGVFLNAKMARSFPAPALVAPAGVEVSLRGVEERLSALGVRVPGGLVREEVGGRQVLSPAEGRWYWEGRLAPETLRRLAGTEKAKGGEFYLSCAGDRLAAALLSDPKRLDFPRVFEEMDFGRCQEFSADALLLVAVARDMGE